MSSKTSNFEQLGCDKERRTLKTGQPRPFRKQDESVHFENVDCFQQRSPVLSVFAEMKIVQDESVLA